MELLIDQEMKMKILRESSNYSLEQIIDFLDDPNYPKYESGEEHPPINVLERLSDLYGIYAIAFFDNSIKVLNHEIKIDDLKDRAKINRIIKYYLKIAKLYKENY